MEQLKPSLCESAKYYSLWKTIWQFLKWLHMTQEWLHMTQMVTMTQEVHLQVYIQDRAAFLEALGESISCLFQSLESSCIVGFRLLSSSKTACSTFKFLSLSPSLRLCLCHHVSIASGLFCTFFPQRTRILINRFDLPFFLFSVLSISAFIFVTFLGLSFGIFYSFFSLD